MSDSNTSAAPDKSDLDPYSDYPLDPSEPCDEHAAWSHDYNARVWDRRIEAETAFDADFWASELYRRCGQPAPTFREKLYALANAFLDHEDDDLAWVGGRIAKMADLARHLDAESGEQLDDREDAMIDAMA